MNTILAILLAASVLLTGCAMKPPSASVTTETIVDSISAAADEVTDVVTEAIKEMPEVIETSPEMVKDLAKKIQKAQESKDKENSDIKEQKTFDFVIEGQTETVPMSTYTTDSFTIDIPSEGWEYAEMENIFLWTPNANNNVRLSVSTEFAGFSRHGAIDLFVADCGYTFEDLIGGTSCDDLLIGTNGDYKMAFFCTENGLIVACEYPLEAEEGFGARMKQMMTTFVELLPEAEDIPTRDSK